MPNCSAFRKATLASILRRARHGVRLNEHLEHDCGLTVFHHACKMGLEGIVSSGWGPVTDRVARRTGSSSRTPDAPAVRREAESTHFVAALAEKVDRVTLQTSQESGRYVRRQAI